VLAGARRELKSYLLGPDEPTSMEQFNAAVRALAAKAEARNAGVAQRLGDQAIAVPDREAAAGDGAVTGEPEAPAETEAGAVADPDAVVVSAVAPETAVEAAAETAVTEGASPR